MEQEQFVECYPTQSISTSRETSTDVLAVARAQKLLIWAVVSSIFSVISYPLYFVVVPFKLFAVYRISKVLGFEMIFRGIYMVGMFIPLFSLVFLLMLNSKATESLQKSGVKVGLTGARRKDLVEILGPGVNPDTQGPAIFVLVLALVAIIGIFTGLLPTPLAPLLGRSSKSAVPSLQKNLQIIADQTNKNLPQMVDEETRLDRISAGQNLMITYHYSLTNYQAKDLNTEAFIANTTSPLKNSACSNEALVSYLKQGVEIAYSYSGSDGKNIATIIIRHEDCGF